MSPKEFFDKYKDWAIQSQARSGVPASIILAQAAVETGTPSGGYGSSRLARIANNFFGVKVHGWTGDYVLADDDKPNEKFRKYKTVYDSFIDHADFLMDQPRYNSLFETTDYKKWAQGLEDAGYATNKQYAELLIGIIEKNNLEQYDRQGDIQMQTVPNTIIRNRKKFYLGLLIIGLSIVAYYVWKKYIK